MTVSNTTRFGLTQWSSGDDEFSREQLTVDFESISTDAAIFLSGTSATPTAAADSNDRAFYWDKTNEKLYFRGDVAGVSQAAWTQIYPVIASGHTHTDLQPLADRLTYLTTMSGSGVIVSKSDGTVVIRSVTSSGSGLSVTNGTGSGGDITISIASDPNATVNTIPIRDGVTGTFKIGTPTTNEHPATKLYVDDADALKANTADVYSKSDIHGAKLYQYANEAGGTGTALPSSGTRTTPRIYVQATEPSSVGAITGDIWFQI